ncbi:hypothetical protein [Nocardia sp. NPDC056100]|uniref:hypothetical protein n=1 Tax=Nocardia sp. NPDC056100 TaxID=3345712 RepID=UPI0035DE0CF7
MTWIAEPIGYANPDYYVDAADSIERQLRADFAKSYQLREIAPYGLTDADSAEMIAHAESLADRWGKHESPQCRHTWETLRSAVNEWGAHPDRARRNLDQLARARAVGEVIIDEVVWRSLHQARAITGHGLGTTTESDLDAHRRFPNLYAQKGSASVSVSAPQQPDARTRVQRTLGAPRDTQALSADLTLDEIDRVVAATEEAMDAEERRGDLDTGRDARSALLPRAIRDAPISYNYAESAAWELRHAALLREIQDLSCEHSTVAEGFDGHNDQIRIVRLEALRDGMGAARRDALRAGVDAADIDRAYLLGRDGIYWSTEPAHPRLGRIAQLTDERDRALSAASSTTGMSNDLHHGPGLHGETSVSSGSGSERTHLSDIAADELAAAGARIVAAIDAVLPAADEGLWVPTDRAQARTPVTADNDAGVDP